MEIGGNIGREFKPGKDVKIIERKAESFGWGDRRDE